jgi:hypothetical protein
MVVTGGEVIIDGFRFFETKDRKESDWLSAGYIRRCAVWPAEPKFLPEVDKISRCSHFPGKEENLID